jgi:hypothetical protein
MPTWAAGLCRILDRRDDPFMELDIADLGWVLHEAVAAHRLMW